MPTVLLVGTLDTKGDELAFVAARLRDAGVGVLVADAGTVGAPHGVEADITREELAAEVGADLASLTDRGVAVGTMADAAVGERVHVRADLGGELLARDVRLDAVRCGERAGIGDEHVHAGVV